MHKLLLIYQFFNPLIKRYDFLLSNDAKIVEFDPFVAILRVILVINTINAVFIKFDGCLYNVCFVFIYYCVSKYKILNRVLKKNQAIEIAKIWTRPR